MKVRSSHILEADYDERTSTMKLTFIGGEQYAYQGVPRDDYQFLVSSQSPGSFLHHWIKPRYQSKRIRG
jgi:hypothetical protein